jgi:hypothetical protein
MLFERDYRYLTKEEKTAYEKAKAFEASNNGFEVDNFFKYHELMPTAGYYYESIFPNNFLSIEELERPAAFQKKLGEYSELIDNPDTGEREVLNFIKDNKAYFIIGSILKGAFDFGHHDAYIFKEFPMPPFYKADFLIVGKNSGGYEFIFVELESVYGSITTKDGNFGMCIRTGISQIDDWDAYIDSNFQSISLLFEQAKMHGINLPQEFIRLDKSRIHYAVIVGKRTDFKEKTRLLQRKSKDQKKIHILHYDNLIDTSKSLLKEGCY